MHVILALSITLSTYMIYDAIRAAAEVDKFKPALQILR